MSHIELNGHLNFYGQNHFETILDYLINFNLISEGLWRIVMTWKEKKFFSVSTSESINPEMVDRAIEMGLKKTKMP